MNTVKVKEADLKKAAAEGMDEFLNVFVTAINGSIGGQLTADTMAELTAEQVTLIAYDILRSEVADGGFVQLIHNGYGGFIFRNPFGKMMRMWGIDGLATLMNKGRKLYFEYHEEIEKDCSDEDFMAMFERYDKFDDLDDDFVENEEDWTEQVARYVDGHIGDFAEVEG